MVIEPGNLDASADNEETATSLGAEMADAEAGNVVLDATDSDKNIQDAGETNLSDDQKAILDLCAEKNITASDLKDFDSYVEAMREHASRLNVQVSGEAKDFAGATVTELRAFIADRKKIATKMGLHGHVAQTTGDADSAREQLMTPGQMIKEKKGN